MKWNSRKKKIIFLFGLLLFISLGYAILSSNMQINGISKLKDSKWDIHFDNVQVNDGSVLINEGDQGAVITPDKDTEVTYAVTLDKPGDFYEFTVDAVNEGTIDGEINLVTSTMMIGDDDEPIDMNEENIPNYLNYSVTYENNKNLSRYHVLKAGETETYKVRIEFKKDIDEEDLPEEDVTISYSFDVDFIQGEKSTPEVEEVVTDCTYNGDLVPGAEYTNGQYTYRYMQEYADGGWASIDTDGWGVVLTDKESTDPVNTNLCTTINGKPIVSMMNMFAGSKTRSINTNSFNTTDVRNMSNMFYNATELEELDMSHFDLSSLNYSGSTHDMFAGTNKLMRITIPKNFITNNSTYIYFENSYYDNDVEYYSLSYANNVEKKTTLVKKYSLYTDDSMVETSTYSGVYPVNTMITLRAKEQDGLVFEKWSNGETTKEISFVLTENTWIYPYFSTNNIAIFDTGYNVNQKIINVSNIPEQENGANELSSSNDSVKPMFLGTNEEKYLKHFERSDTLIPEIASIDLDVISVSEDEIMNYIVDHHNDYDFDDSVPENEKMMIAEKRIRYEKKAQLLGDHLISSPYSGYDIYGWFDRTNETYYYYTECDNVFLNSQSGSFFKDIYSLEDLNGLKEVKTYMTTDMTYMFYNCSSIEYLDLGNFDLSNLHYALESPGPVNRMLYGTSSLKKIITPKVGPPILPYSNIAIDLCDIFYDKNNDSYKTIDYTTEPRSVLTVEQSAVFDTGEIVNSKLKVIAGNGYALHTSSISYNDVNTYQLGIDGRISLTNQNDDKIRKIIKADSLPEDFVYDDFNIISTDNSYYAIYAWYDEDDGTIYYYTKANKIHLNANSDGMFSDMLNLESIDGLGEFDTTFVWSIKKMFNNCRSLKSLDMNNWDLSNLYTLEDAFYGTISLEEIVTPKKMFESWSEKLTTPIMEFIDSDGIWYDYFNKWIPANTTLTDNYLLIEFNNNGGNYEKIYDLFDDVGKNKLNFPFNIEDFGYYWYGRKGDSIGALPVLSKDFNYFLGWYTDLENGIKVDENYIPTSNTVLYARWKECNYYEITFDKNNENATGDMGVQVVPDVESKLNNNVFESSLDEVFIGWNTKRDGTGISYANCALVTLDDNITLYAQWFESYDITFDKNNSDAVLSDGFETTMKAAVALPTTLYDNLYYMYELDGKMIDSWNTKSDYSGITYYKNQQITVTGDITLYAHWTDLDVSDTIYWGIDTTYNELVLSSYDLERTDLKITGSVSSDDSFTYDNLPPWLYIEYYNEVEERWYNREDISKVSIKGVVLPKSTAYWFYELGFDAENIIFDLDNLITSYVTDMSSMFNNTGGDVSNLSLDISNFDTSNVLNMNQMFKYFGYDSTELTIIGLDNINTSKVEDMSGMFWGVGDNLTSFNIVNLSNWDTSKVEDMSNMFRDSGRLATTWSVGNLSNWNTSNVRNMFSMFYYAGFKANEWSIGNIGKWNTSKVTNMGQMFYDAGYNTTTFNLNLSNWNTSRVEDMHSMFYGAGGNATSFTIDVSNWNVSRVKKIYNLFRGAGYNSSTWTIGDLSNWDTSRIKSMSNMFSYTGTNATTWSVGDISKWNTSNVTYMPSMFYNAGMHANFFDLDLSNWNTLNVTNMSYMFYSAGMYANFFNLDLSNWNTSKVKDMRGMFYSAGYRSKYFKIDISKWNTSRVLDYYDMFNKAGTLNAKSWEVIIPRTNGVSLTNNSTTLYGRDASISVSPPSGKKFTIMGADDWETIVSNVANGNTSEYTVGSTKTVDMGEFGIHTLRVANNSTPSECLTTGFSQTACGFVLEFADIITKNKMNATIPTSGGWPASAMRTYVNSDIYNSLPAVLKNAIVDTQVVSGYGNGALVSTDKLYLLSTHEVWVDSDGNSNGGIDYYDNGYSNTRQLDYYANNQVKTTSNFDFPKKNYNNITNQWWLRSAYSNSNYYFYTVDTYGSDSYRYADYSYGISPAFRLRGPSTNSKYLIEFDANGGSVLEDSKIIDVETSIGELPTPEWDEWHVFDGWYTGVETGIKVNSDYIPSANMTLYAHWTEINHNEVTLDANGGDVDPEEIEVGDGLEIGELPVPTRYGYYFDGWTTELNGTIKIDSHYIPNSDVTIYASWKKSVQSLGIDESYVDIYMPNQGGHIDLTGSSEIDESYSISVSNPGIVSVDSNGDVTDISEGYTTILITGNTSNQVIEIYVEVYYYRHKIDFVTYGGGMIDPIGVKVDEAIGTLPTTTLDNYYLEGWYTEDTYENKVDSSFVPETNTTLYARWVYDVIYDANGGVFGDSSTEKTVTYDRDVHISRTSNINDNGDAESDCPKNLSTTDTISIPGAKRLKIDVWYSTVGSYSSWLAIYPGDVTPDSDNYSEATISKGKLGGYNSSVSPYKYSYHKTFYYNGDTINIYFKSNNYSNNYYGYYATVTSVDLPNSYNQVTTKDAVNSHGWCSDVLCSEGSELENIERTSVSTRVYARYAYDIDFETYDGEVSINNKDITVGQSIGKLPKPVKNNYYFLGWYKEDTFDTLIDENYVPTSNMTLHAKWRDLEYYQVTFEKNSNEAVGSMNNQVIAEDNETVLSKNLYTRSGYQFMGWNTEIDGTGTSYLDEGDITLNSNVTLYAQWLKSYTLIFDKNDNDAVGDSYSMNVLSGIATQIPRDAFWNYRITGKLITDFNSENDGNGISYYKGQSITITNDTTIYADWNSYVQKSFKEDDWDTIIASVKDGNAEAYTVGSTKKVSMGTFGTHSLRVANNSNASECSNDGFSETACGFVLEFADIVTNYQMNPYNYNATVNGDGNKGGWEFSEIRDYINSDIYNALPVDLQDGIISTRVVSGHGEDDLENFITNDKLYLLSLHEVFLDDYYTDYDTSYNYTRCLDYYNYNNYNNNYYYGYDYFNKPITIDFEKRYINITKPWWLRTPNSNNNIKFYYVDRSGEFSSRNESFSNYMNGISPAFRIG